MIGNDIVDLSEAAIKNNWKRKGLLQKIFNKEEQMVINESIEPDKIVWLFWSMKESAYKAFKRINSNVVSNPLNFICIADQNYSSKNKIIKGKVIIENSKYITESLVTDKFISTIATANNLDTSKVRKRTFRLSDNRYFVQHFEVYSEIINEVKRILNNQIKKIELKKDLYGIPYLFDGEKKLNYSVSLSHHGRYGAFNILSEIYY